jgi:hypothetical protein
VAGCCKERNFICNGGKSVSATSLSRGEGGVYRTSVSCPSFANLRVYCTTGVGVGVGGGQSTPELLSSNAPPIALRRPPPARITRCR